MTNFDHVNKNSKFLPSRIKNNGNKLLKAPKLLMHSGEFEEIRFETLKLNVS